MAHFLMSKTLTSCSRGLGRQTSILQPNLNHSFIKVRLRANVLHTARGTTPRAPGVVSVRMCAVVGRGTLLLAYVSPFGFLKRKKLESCYQEEVIANIPKEVFVNDVVIKKKHRHILIVRLFNAILKNLLITLRFIRVTLIFGPLFLVYPLTCLNYCFRKHWWGYLKWACVISGPTFTKFAQWAGTRRDLFSEQFCDIFSTLHTEVTPHSWCSTRNKLTKAFGKNWTKIFIAVDREPIGSGCIGQVHKAYMRSDMIPDESVIEEALDDGDDGTDIDFSEGLEILGFGQVMDCTIEPDVEPEYEHSWRWWRQKGVPAPTTPPPCTPPDTSGVEPFSPMSLHGEEGCIKPPTMPADPSDIEDCSDVQLIPVAIKVLHPGVFRAAKQDIAILKFIARSVEFLIPCLRWMSLSECVDEFAQLMTKQVDLRYECRALEKFIDNFADNPNIRFPRPIRPYCKRDVLVETFEEGEHISNFINDKVESVPVGFKETLATYGLDALLQMVFVDNLVHCDLHPGNILVQNASSYIPDDENKLMLVDLCDTVVVNVLPADNPVRLVILDAGICTSLSDTDLDNLKKVFTAIFIGEGKKVAELMLEHSTHECLDVKAFKEDLCCVVMQARKMTIKLGKLEVGRLLLTVFRVLKEHHVKMESNFVSIILAVFVLEGIARSLDPEVDILERAKPLLLT